MPRPLFHVLALPAGLPDVPTLLGDFHFAQEIFVRQLAHRQASTVYWPMNRELLHRYSADYHVRSIDSFFRDYLPDHQFKIRLLPRQATVAADLRVFAAALPDRVTPAVVYCPWTHQDLTRALVHRLLPNSFVMAVTGLSGHWSSWSIRARQLLALPWHFLQNA